MAILAAAKETALPALTHFGICNCHLFLKIATQELASNSWAFLTSLSLRDSHLPVDSAKHLQTGNWQHLVSLDLSHCLSRQIPGRLTEKKIQRAADTLVASCCYLAAGNWPHHVTLDLSHNCIAAAEMAELAKGNWPALRKLSLRANKGLFMKQLASAQLTRLQELDLGCLQFSRDDLQQLQNMQWPQLTALDFQMMTYNQGFTTKSFQAAWQSIQLQQWPLAKLRIAEPMFGVTLASWSSLTWLDVSSFALRPDQVEMLLHARGQTLDTLRVFCQASSKTEAKPNAGSWPRNTFLRLELLLDEAVLHSLSLGHWPAKVVDIVMGDADRVSPDTVGANLRKLDLLRLNSVLLESDLTVKGLKADSLKHLVEDLWCRFEKLDLTCAYLGKAFGVQHLVNGRWPLLRELALSHPHLTLNCLEQLVSAQWPLLEKLVLRGNRIRAAGAQCLVKGQWPSLTTLDLSNNYLRSGDMMRLVQGNWPVLAELQLQHNVFNKIDPSGWSDYEHCSETEDRERGLNAQREILHCLQRRWAQLVVCFEYVARSDDLSTHVGICALSLR